MPKIADIDNDKLLEMVKTGVPQGDIMQKIGIKTTQQLKAAILNAYIIEGTIPRLVGGRRTRGKTRDGNHIKVNKRGSLIITKELVSNLGYNEGDEFSVTKSDFGIDIRKV